MRPRKDELLDPSPAQNKVISWDGREDGANTDVSHPSPLFLFSSSLGAFSILLVVWGSLPLCSHGSRAYLCLLFLFPSPTLFCFFIPLSCITEALSPSHFLASSCSLCPSVCLFLSVSVSVRASGLICVSVCLSVCP